MSETAIDCAVRDALKFLQELRHPTPPTPCRGGIIIEDCGGPCVRCGATDKSACPFTAEHRAACNTSNTKDATMTDPYIPPLTFPLRVTEAHPTPYPRSDLWDANGMFIANISTAWAVQIRDATKPLAHDRAHATAGMVFVPREATDAMIAAQYERYGGGGLDMGGRYRTMIDQALDDLIPTEPTFPQRLRELASKWGDKNETHLAKMLREAAGMIEGGL